MMAGDKRGCEIVFCDIIPIITTSTSEVWAAHFMVTLTPAHTLAHVLPVDTGKRAGVVGLETKILTVLIWIVTLQGSINVVTVSGHGQLPTFTAFTIITIDRPSLHLGAVPSRWNAAVLMFIVGAEWVRWSTMTPGKPGKTLIPAPLIDVVVAGVRVAGDVKIVTRVSCSHFPNHQHDKHYHSHNLHTWQYYKSLILIKLILQIIGVTVTFTYIISAEQTDISRKDTKYKTMFRIKECQI